MISFKKVRTLFIFWFVIISCVPLSIISIIIYAQRAESIKTRELEKLSAIRDLKVERLNDWYNWNIESIELLAKDIENNEQLLISLSKGFIIKKSFSNSEILTSNFSEISIFKKEENSLDNTDSFAAKARIICLKQNKKFFSTDIITITASAKPSMYFCAKIFNGQYILMAKADLEHRLYPILINRTGVGETGETLIVNSENYALNELRWFDDAPLKLKIDAQPAREAASGIENVIETLDYRGIPVLASYTNFEKMGWGLIVKQDRSEIYKPVYEMMIQIILLYLISLLIIVLCAVKLSKSISEPLMVICRGANSIANNNFDFVFPENRSDELGYLGKTINQMSKALKSNIEQIHNLLKVTNSQKGELEVYRNHLQEQVAERTKSLELEMAERQKLETEALSISEKERQQIGQTLHDSLGQKLTGVSYMLDALQRSNNLNHKQLSDKLKMISLTIKESLEETRSLSRGLCPFQTEVIGLPQALEELISDIEKIYPVHCSLYINLEFPDRNQQTNIYYIIREAINNALKHGKASRISIELTHTNGKRTILIKDNGSGFNTKHLYNGLGLKIMEYRTNILGGVLKIQSDKINGTCLQIILEKEYT